MVHYSIGERKKNPIVLSKLVSGLQIKIEVRDSYVGTFLVWTKNKDICKYTPALLLIISMVWIWEWDYWRCWVGESYKEVHWNMKENETL